MVWLLTLLCMAFIFYMSSRSIESSRSDSARLIAALNLVDQEEDLYNENDQEMFKLHNSVRKAAHLVLYASLGALYFVSVYGYFGGVRVSGAIALLFTAFYGATDEIHQIFTHRGAGIIDVLIDTLGGLAGIVVVGVIFFIIEKNKRCKTFWSYVYDFEPNRRKLWKK